MVTYNKNPFLWTSADVNTSVVQVEFHTDDENHTRISMNNLPTPVDIYLPMDEMEISSALSSTVLVTSGVTSLLRVQTGGGTNVAIKVYLRIIDTNSTYTLR